jgi:hypothetical protein
VSAAPLAVPLPRKQIVREIERSAALEVRQGTALAVPKEAALSGALTPEGSINRITFSRDKY